MRQLRQSYVRVPTPGSGQTVGPAVDLPPETDGWTIIHIAETSYPPVRGDDEPAGKHFTIWMERET